VHLAVDQQLVKLVYMIYHDDRDIVEIAIPDNLCILFQVIEIIKST
jgi:hypothetical protein